MSNYTQTDIGSGYNTSSAINTELTEVETAIASKMDKSGTTMTGDLDINSNDILNANAIGTQALSIAGTQVTATDLATTTLPAQSGHENEFLTTDGTTASWGTIVTGEINIEDYVTDDNAPSAAINTAALAAFTQGKALVAKDRSRTYVLDAQIDLRELQWIDLRCTFDTSAIDETETDGCILLGRMGNPSATSPHVGKVYLGGHWEIGPVLGSGSGTYGFPSYPQIRMGGVKGIKMSFDRVQYLQVFLDFTNGSGAGEATGVYTNNAFAYNHMDFASTIGLFEVTSDEIYTGGSDFCWMNENTFWGGRFNKVRLPDTLNNGPNHNKWYNSLFEGSGVEITIDRGIGNFFFGVRFESTGSSTGITLGELTFNHVFQVTYLSSVVPHQTGFDLTAGGGNTIPWSDLGSNNDVHHLWAEDYTRTVVAALSPTTTILGCGKASVQYLGASNVRGVCDYQRIDSAFSAPVVIGGLNGIVYPYTFARILQTDFIPVHAGTIFQIAVGNPDEKDWRYRVDCYDANKVPLVKASWDGMPLDGGVSGYSLAYTPGNSYFSATSAINKDYKVSPYNPVPFSVLDPDIKYISIMVGSGADTDFLCDFAAITMMDKPSGQMDTLTAASALNSTAMYMPYAPTTGIAPVGTHVALPASTVKCTFELQTTLTASAANGATVISIAEDDNSGRPTTIVANGDIVGVLLTDGTTHWTTVASKSSLDITLTAGIASAKTTGSPTALSGAPVAFCRWVTA